MDRQIVYPGAIPLDTDLLAVQRSTLAALGYLAQAALGTGSVVDGLACTPTAPASLSIIIGPGSLSQLASLDTLSFGSLPAEPGEPLVKVGINLDPTSFTLAAPTASGQAINYLIEASFLEQDTTPVVLPYYNAANPGQPYSGPNNSGSAQNTQRIERVQLQAKAGAPGTMGSQTTPAIDAGWVGLYVITVGYGQTTIGAGSISVLPEAPFIPYKLPQLAPGVRNLAIFTPTSQGQWSVPAGVSAVRVRLWGGGGAGGAGGGGAGGGGAGGGYAEGYYAVTPGQVISVTVGSGGAGAGTAGGTSSFGALTSASGGSAGINGATNTGAGGATAAGSGVGRGLVLSGSSGGAGFVVPGAVWVGGGGGGAFGASGGAAVSSPGGAAETGANGQAPGGGGGGGIGGGLGGSGGAGLVLVEW